MSEALQSVAGLKGLDKFRVEVVLADDASTDRSVEIFRHWRLNAPVPTELVIRPRNGGTASALNSAAQRAKGQWIWPLAHDDIFIADALDEWDALRRRGADAIPSGYQAFGHDSNGVPIDEASSRSRRLYRVHDIVQGFRRGSHLSSGCSPFRRRFWEMVGFDEDLRTAEDTLFWLRIAKRGARFIPSRRPLIRVRYHANRKSFTPIARDRRTKIRMVKDRMDRETADFVASETHFIEHAAPVWRALAPWARGRFYVPRPLVRYAESFGVRAVGYRPTDLFDVLKKESVLTVTASAGDQQAASVAGRWTVYGEHGSGQTYSRRHSSYANWPHRRNVALFLAPGPEAAKHFRAQYPRVRTIEIGVPHLAPWQRGEEPIPTGDTVAISFHWNCKVVPETTSAWSHYAKVLPALAKRFDIIGHSHPRIADKMRTVYERAGIEFVASFDEVLRRARVYAVDNSSTLFSFAAASPPGTTRPVVVLNAPAYRRGVNHGMRFWEYADIGPQVDNPSELAGAFDAALNGDVSKARRMEIVSQIYAYRDGSGASVAARAIEHVLDSPLPSAIGHPKNRRLFAMDKQTARGRGSVAFNPKTDNRKTMAAKTVRMVAKVTFANKQHEGQVRRGQAFYTTEARAKVLSSPKHDIAYRASVGPASVGPAVTKPATPTYVKATPTPTPTPAEKPQPPSPPESEPEPEPRTVPQLKKWLDAKGVEYPKKARKPVLVELYQTHR